MYRGIDADLAGISQISARARIWPTAKVPSPPPSWYRAAGTAAEHRRGTPLARASPGRPRRAVLQPGRPACNPPPWPSRRPPRG